MRRVLVIGISGAGKSTFSRALAGKTGLPLIHLDKEFWQPGWKITPRAEWRGKVTELVARDAWIMDGNFDSSLDLRLPRADTVVWFDHPTLVCLGRALRRVVNTYGQVRTDMGEGCPGALRPGVFALHLDVQCQATAADRCGPCGVRSTSRSRGVSPRPRGDAIPAPTFGVV